MATFVLEIFPSSIDSIFSSADWYRLRIRFRFTAKFSVSASDGPCVMLSVTVSLTPLVSAFSASKKISRPSTSTQA
ncbi:hypothetical protein D3C86_2126290 [compost metagenome]